MNTTYSVWVGGQELNAHYLTFEQAKNLANEYIQGGYEDVAIEEVNV